MRWVVGPEEMIPVAGVAVGVAVAAGAPLPAPSRYKPPSSRSLSRVQGATKMWDE